MTTLPQLSRNGTSTEELLHQQLEVLAAARALETALLIAYPHGRDYQYRPEEGDAARAEVNTQLASVDPIIARALELKRFLYDQLPANALPYTRARVVLDETAASGIRIEHIDNGNCAAEA